MVPIKVQMLEDYGVTIDCTPWLEKGKEYELEDELAVELLANARAKAVTETRKQANYGNKVETAAVKPTSRRRKVSE